MRKVSDISDLKGKALELAGLVEYQSGSVVSRTLIDGDMGTVSVFAFDQGQGLSEHTAPFDAMVYIAEGTAEIAISGKSNTVTEGQMIIMPADQPHSLKAGEKFKMALIMIRTKK